MKGIVDAIQFVEGLVVEFTEDEEKVIRCQEYVIKDGELDSNGEYCSLDIMEIMSKPTLEERMEELTRQIGTEDFYVTDDVYELFEDFEDIEDFDILDTIY